MYTLAGPEVIDSRRFNPIINPPRKIDMILIVSYYSWPNNVNITKLPLYRVWDKNNPVRKQRFTGYLINFNIF